MGEPDPSTGVYGISVAAELTGLTVRSLRLYERHGLLNPARTAGGTRRFSQDDLRRARRIADLMADGVNLAGIGKILGLEQHTDSLRRANTTLRTENTALQADNTALRADQTRRTDHPRHARDPDTTRRSRRSPAGGHRDQPSRPG
jgi:MerR family transcriptional regulator/heat shock protein HspR